MTERDGGPPPVASPGSPPEAGEHPTDLLASYALGVLEPDEHEAVEAHVRGCATCAAELQELRGAVDALPFAAPPVAPPVSVRQALMERVGATVREPARTGEDVEPAMLRAAPAARGGAWTPAAAWGVALACAAVAAVSTWQLIATRADLTALRRDAAAQEAALRQQVDALAQMDPQSLRVAPLRGSPQAAGISGRVLYDANGTNGLAVLDHLPPLPPGKVYQLWLLQGATPVSAGIFRSDSDGTGSLVIRAPRAIGSFSGLGLTAEPDPGVAAPTGAILATGAL